MAIVETAAIFFLTALLVFMKIFIAINIRDFDTLPFLLQ